MEFAFLALVVLVLLGVFGFFVLAIVGRQSKIQKQVNMIESRLFFENYKLLKQYEFLENGKTKNVEKSFVSTEPKPVVLSKPKPMTHKESIKTDYFSGTPESIADKTYKQLHKKIDRVDSSIDPMLGEDRIVTVAIVGEKEKYLNIYKLEIKAGNHAISDVIKYIDTDFARRQMSDYVIISVVSRKQVKIVKRNKFGEPEDVLETHSIVDVKPKKDLNNQ
jgi:hypothetical protein